MIKFIKKNPAIPQRWIVLTALAYSLTAAQAQTPQAEKAFIKENMEFATKQRKYLPLDSRLFPWYIMVSIKLHRRQSFARLCISLYTSNGTRKDLHRQS